MDRLPLRAPVRWMSKLVGEAFRAGNGADDERDAARLAYRIGWIVLLPVGLLQAFWTRLDFGLLLDHFLNDDAFLYLQVARNIADHGRVTFDGGSTTTGIQPLWTLLLTALAAVIDDREELVRAVLLLSVGFNVAAGLLLARASAALCGAPAAAGFTAALWAGYMLVGRPALLGMESGLVALTFAGLLAFIVLRPPPAVPRWGWRIAVAALGAGVFLSRTDSVLLLAPLGILVVLLHRESAGRWRPALWNGALAAGVCFVLVAPYLAFNLGVSGALMPVSGSVKMWYAAQNLPGGGYFTPGAVSEAAERVVEIINVVVMRVLPGIDLAAEEIRRRADVALKWVGSLAGLAVLGLAVGRRRKLPASVQKLFLALGIGGVLHALALAMFLGVFSEQEWYYVPQCAAGCLFAGTLLVRAMAARPALTLAVTGAVVLLLAARVSGSHSKVTSPDPGLHRYRVEVAQKISSVLPPGAVIGAWNAGELAYFSRRRVVNLDGLVNDTRFFRHLRWGGDVRQYLREEGIDYVADYNARDASVPRWFEWDARESFRGLWPLSDLDVLIRGKGDPSVLVFPVPR